LCYNADIKDERILKMTIYQVMSAYGFMIKIGLVVLMGLYLIWFIPTAKKYIKKSKKRGKR
jgi:hypothetical protein